MGVGLLFGIGEYLVDQEILNTYLLHSSNNTVLLVTSFEKNYSFSEPFPRLNIYLFKIYFSHVKYTFANSVTNSLNMKKLNI